MKNLEDIIQYEVEKAGIKLDSTKKHKVLMYLELLKKWGNKLNLTSITDPVHVIQHQIRDAFELSRTSHELFKSQLRWADVGSGAGFLGIIIAICRPEIKMILIEKNKKKCAFLRTIAAKLALDTEIIQMRIEDIDIKELDVAISRATWSPQEWIFIGKKIIKKGGIIVIFTTKRNIEIKMDRYLKIFYKLEYVLVNGRERTLFLIS